MKLSKVRLSSFILTALTAGCVLGQPGPPSAGLGSEQISAFIAIKDAKRAMAFYRDTLGLRLVRTEPIALVFDANGVMLRIQIVSEVSVAPYTVLGWKVPEIAATVGKLEKAGVTLLRVPGVKQDDHGIWKASNGDQVAWFKDPEGHILSVAQIL